MGRRVEAPGSLGAHHSCLEACGISRFTCYVRDTLGRLGRGLWLSFDRIAVTCSTLADGYGIGLGGDAQPGCFEDDLGDSIAGFVRSRGLVCGINGQFSRMARRTLAAGPARTNPALGAVLDSRSASSLGARSSVG